MTEEEEAMLWFVDEQVLLIARGMMTGQLEKRNMPLCWIDACPRRKRIAELLIHKNTQREILVQKLRTVGNTTWSLSWFICYFKSLPWLLSVSVSVCQLGSQVVQSWTHLTARAVAVITQHLFCRYMVEMHTCLQNFFLNKILQFLLEEGDEHACEALW